MLHNQKTEGEKKKTKLKGAQTFTSSLNLANFWTRVQMILKAAQLHVPAFQSCGFAVCLFLQRESVEWREGRCRKGLPCLMWQTGLGGCMDCLGKSHSDFVGSTPPFAEIYTWKYEICECVFADSQIKGPRGLIHRKRERRRVALCSLTSTALIVTRLVMGN